MADQPNLLRPLQPQGEALSPEHAQVRVEVAQSAEKVVKKANKEKMAAHASGLRKQLDAAGNASKEDKLKKQIPLIFADGYTNQLIANADTFVKDFAATTEFDALIDQPERDIIKNYMVCYLWMILPEKVLINLPEFLSKRKMLNEAIKNRVGLSNDSRKEVLKLAMVMNNEGLGKAVEKLLVLEQEATAQGVLNHKVEIAKVADALVRIV